MTHEHVIGRDHFDDGILYGLRIGQALPRLELQHLFKGLHENGVFIAYSNIRADVRVHLHAVA